jgi:indolepyruvate ferredoxin oxidoreductase
VASELGIEGAYSLRYHLHPPVLRRLGMSGKLPMGRPYELAFGVLARMKRLRGTRLDPFGRDRDRRTERALIEEYEGLMGDALDAAARIAAGHGAASGPALDELVSLARSPMDIRGYAEVKDAAVARWRDRVGAPAGRTRSTGGSRR